jgi:hypothetical protein
VTIGRTHEGIVVGGEHVGSATIEAYSGSSLVASLAVTVKPMRRETVSFFFVRDSGSMSTARTEDQATLLTLRLNRVWRRQANVLFSLGQVHSVSGSRFAEFERFAISGQFNVFCVADGATVMGSSSVAFLSDADCGDKMDVAHAAGRYLGFTGPDANDGLMAACGSGAERRRVSKMLADIVNP